MARIIGGIGASHTPTIGFAFDKDKREEPAWRPIFDMFAPIEQWLRERSPDAIVYVFNDHVTSFFFDHYSAFTLGVDDAYAVADEGGGARALPAVRGHAALAALAGRGVRPQVVVRQPPAPGQVPPVPAGRREALLREELPVRRLGELEAVLHRVLEEVVEAPRRRARLAPDKVLRE